MSLSRRTLLPALSLAAAAFASAPVSAKSNDFKDLQAAVEKAIQGDGVLRLPAGSFKMRGLRIEKPVRIEGVPGLTRILCEAGGANVVIVDAAGVSLSGLTFVGDPAPNSSENAGAAMIMARGCGNLVIENCAFQDSGVTALSLEKCSGRVSNNSFARIGETAIFALDSEGLAIAGNVLDDIGNNGILVWRSAIGEDGTLVNGNRIKGVAAKQGGTGQNGNGINVFRAGNVQVANNRVSDCAFSGVRNNSGSNCQIIGNSISRTGEVAIYCEFNFQGAVVSNNLLEDVAFGISITNYNEGGRLAVVSNNVIRKVTGGGSLPDTRGTAIGVEADTLVIGNVVEEARDNGISLGWMKYSRNLAAQNNIIHNCGRGIGFSVSDGAGAVMISGNRIAGSLGAAIQGMDGRTAVTGDLGQPGAVAPAGHTISGNLIS